MTAWIWNSSDWPSLKYRAEPLAEPLKVARIEYGRLLGKAEAIAPKDLASLQQNIWAGEAVATAAIEGEVLNLAAVRSSVARRLGINTDFTAHIPRNVEGLLDVMESAAADWDSDLTEDRLCRWQAALFPAGGTALRSVTVGRYRAHEAPMQIVSGPIGSEKVHYVAPPSNSVGQEMQAFLAWFNRNRTSVLDGIVRAGLAHVWFESIHPFEDGNGRVGRAIIDLALAQDARQATRLHGVAIELRRRQAEYYEMLNQAQRGTGDVTDWLVWFVRVFHESCRASGVLIDESLVRARFWRDHQHIALNERQRKVLNKVLEAGPGAFEGGLTLRKYANMTGISRVTAWRDLEDLLQKKLIVTGDAKGRSTHYNINIRGWEWVARIQ